MSQKETAENKTSRERNYVWISSLLPFNSKQCILWRPSFKNHVFESKSAENKTQRGFNLHVLIYPDEPTSTDCVVFKNEIIRRGCIRNQTNLKYEKQRQRQSNDDDQIELELNNFTPINNGRNCRKQNFSRAKNDRTRMVHRTVRRDSHRSHHGPYSSHFKTH